MKKIITALLIITMSIVFSGCFNIGSENSTKGVIQEKSDEIQAAAVAEKSLEIPPEARAMFRSCSQLISYLAVSVYEIDLQNLSAEDFWLILSLVTYAENPGSVGEFGTIDLEYEAVYDIAETFLSEMLLSSGMPAPKGIYSASYVSAEQLYELQPVSISDIDTELVSLEKEDQEGQRFRMKINLLDHKDRIKNKEWYVLIEAWGDGREHFLPYKFVRAWYVG